MMTNGTWYNIIHAAAYLFKLFVCQFVFYLFFCIFSVIVFLLFRIM